MLSEFDRVVLYRARLRRFFALLPEAVGIVVVFDGKGPGDCAQLTLICQNGQQVELLFAQQRRLNAIARRTFGATLISIYIGNDWVFDELLSVEEFDID